MQQDISQVNRMRANMYAFLSEAFLEELDTDDMARIAAEETDHGPALLEELPDDVGEEDQFAGIDKLQEFAEHVRKLDDKGREELERELAVEYANLFLAGKDDQVNPYENFYIGKEPILQGERTVHVKTVMKELGYEEFEEHAEPPDHIGLELEFMAYLCNSAALNLDAGEDEYAGRYLDFQQKFLERHLLKWAPDACDDIIESTEALFYEGLAELTKDFLQSEPAAIEEMVELLEAEAA